MPSFEHRSPTSATSRGGQPVSSASPLPSPGRRAAATGSRPVATMGRKAPTSSCAARRVALLRSCAIVRLGGASGDRRDSRGGALAQSPTGYMLHGPPLPLALDTPLPPPSSRSATAATRASRAIMWQRCSQLPDHRAPFLEASFPRTPGPSRAAGSARRAPRGPTQPLAAWGGDLALRGTFSRRLGARITRATPPPRVPTPTATAPAPRTPPPPTRRPTPRAPRA